MKAVVNFVLFQLCWFAAIAGAAKGYPYLGPAAVTVSALFQLWWRKGRISELGLYGFAILLGVVCDGALERFGVLGFVVADAEAVRLVVPVWMLALWVNFATTLPSSLAWLRSRLGLSAVLGAIGGPLAYWGGESFGAVILGDDGVSKTAALGWVAVEYAVATPILALVANQVLPKLKSKEKDA